MGFDVYGGAAYLVMCGWDSIPHLTEQAKEAMLRTLPPYQRDARTKGIPQLGSGAIYCVPETEICVKRFTIPDDWPRVYALDVGHKCTAAIWAARDPSTKVIYLYSEYYVGREEPSIHAAAIRGRGAWLPGVIDPAARGRSQIDGRQLMQMYRDLGLDIHPANNAVQAGIDLVWELLSSGMLKVFDDLNNWLAEYRFYRRDEKGHIVKARDHLMDATRYLIMSGRDRMRTAPAKTDPYDANRMGLGRFPGSWMA